MDPELGKKVCDVELPAAQPKRKCNRVCLIAGCFVALVLLSLVELLVLPLRSFGADDARINIFFDGRDIIVDARAHPTPARSTSTRPACRAPSATSTRASTTKPL